MSIIGKLENGFLCIAAFIWQANFSDTFLEKLKDETPNDRNDRGKKRLLDSEASLVLIWLLMIAIRVATQWYTNHLKESGILTIMLSDDRANREKAASMGVKSQSGINRGIERRKGWH